MTDEEAQRLRADIGVLAGALTTVTATLATMIAQNYHLVSDEDGGQDAIVDMLTGFNELAHGIAERVKGELGEVGTDPRPALVVGGTYSIEGAQAPYMGINRYVYEGLEGGVYRFHYDKVPEYLLADVPVGEEHRIAPWGEYEDEGEG